MLVLYCCSSLRDCENNNVMNECVVLNAEQTVSLHHEIPRAVVTGFFRGSNKPSTEACAVNRARSK